MAFTAGSGICMAARPIRIFDYCKLSLDACQGMASKPLTSLEPCKHTIGTVLQVGSDLAQAAERTPGTYRRRQTCGTPTCAPAWRPGTAG